jgi:hypothetical protein
MEESSNLCIAGPARAYNGRQEVVSSPERVAATEDASAGKIDTARNASATLDRAIAALVVFRRTLEEG